MKDMKYLLAGALVLAALPFAPAHAGTAVSYSVAGAPHAFTVFGSGRYQEQADRQSWASFTTMLDELFPAE